MEHKTVLLHEAIDGLSIMEGDVFVDATLGRGGHSSYVAEKFSSQVKIVGIDADKDSIQASEERLSAYKDVSFTALRGNFRDIDLLLSGIGTFPTKVLFDLGWNTNQFEEGGRGFSFQKDEPLIMAYSDNPLFTARDIVNEWEEESIANIIFAYGEERYSRRIARAIMFERAKKPIETAIDLANIIVRAVPVAYNKKRIHPATKTFQALRIAVNDELGALKEGLQKTADILSVGGRIAVIAFHSLEDRIVKNFFKELKEAGDWNILYKKPLTPSPEEVLHNPRARSAKLRIIEKK